MQHSVFLMIEAGIEVDFSPAAPESIQRERESSFILLCVLSLSLGSAATESLDVSICSFQVYRSLLKQICQWQSKGTDGTRRNKGKGSCWKFRLNLQNHAANFLCISVPLTVIPSLRASNKEAQQKGFDFAYLCYTSLLFWWQLSDFLPPTFDFLLFSKKLEIAKRSRAARIPSSSCSRRVVTVESKAALAVIALFHRAAYNNDCTSGSFHCFNVKQREKRGNQTPRGGICFFSTVVKRILQQSTATLFNCN